LSIDPAAQGVSTLILPAVSGSQTLLIIDRAGGVGSIYIHIFMVTLKAPQIGALLPSETLEYEAQPPEPLITTPWVHES